MNQIPKIKQNDTATLASWHIQMQQASQSPWLAALLLKRAQRLQQRLAYFYQELQNLPRRWRRKLQKLLAAGLVGAALMLAFGPTPSVHAATITVDGVCTLADAITAANTNTATGNCIAGDVGADTINLQTNVTLGGVLPTITSVITLEGNGFTVSGNNSVRVFNVQSGGDLTINNATVTGGNTAAQGGGIAVYSGTLTVNDSTISGNTATSRGGGIFNYEGTVTINSSTVSGNNSSAQGAGINNFAGPGTATMTLNNTTVSGNTASSRGGGIYNFGSTGTATATLSNSTVTGNNGARGGAVYNQGTGTVGINRSILSGNSAPGGDEIFESGGGTTANNYNILGDNANTTAQAFNGFTPCSGGGCTDVNAASNASNIPIGSILNTTLADNGGPTFTHALVGGSPALDTIPTSDPNCNPGTSVDQRGAARANGADQGGTACDSGAYELSAEDPTAISLQNITTNPRAAQTGLIAALLAGLSAVSLALYRRFKITN